MNKYILAFLMLAIINGCSKSYDETTYNNYEEDYDMAESADTYVNKDALPEFEISVFSQLSVGHENLRQELFSSSGVDMGSRYNTFLTIVSKNEEVIEIYGIVVNKGISCSHQALKGTMQYGQKASVTLGCQPDQVLDVLIQTNLGDVHYTMNRM